MRSIRTVLLTVVVAAAGTVAAAGPAAADHLLVVDPAACSAGVFTANLPGDIQTRNRYDVRIEARPDGTVQATCTFRGLPREAFNEVIEEMWFRPAPGTVDDLTGCLLADYPGRPFEGQGEWMGTGAMTFGPSNKATSVCTFDPAYFEGAPAV